MTGFCRERHCRISAKGLRARLHCRPQMRWVHQIGIKAFDRCLIQLRATTDGPRTASTAGGSADLNGQDLRKQELLIRCL